MSNEHYLLWRCGLSPEPIDRLIAQDEAFDVLDVWMTEAARADDWERYNRMSTAWLELVMEP